MPCEELFKALDKYLKDHDGYQEKIEGNNINLNQEYEEDLSLETPLVSEANLQNVPSHRSIPRPAEYKLQILSQQKDPASDTIRKAKRSSRDPDNSKTKKIRRKGSIRSKF